MRQLQHEPVLCNPLHPAAGIGDDLAGREEPVIPRLQRAESRSAPAADAGQDWLSFSRTGAAARSAARSCGVSPRSCLASHASRSLRDCWTTSLP